MPERFDDLPVLAGLGASLRDAMAAVEAAETAPVAVPDRHSARRRRRGPRNFGALSSILVVGLVGSAAAAATLTILRGSPIPAPRAADLQPAMTARADTERVLDLRAADPSGTGAPFALRTGTSEGGLTCVTVGQVVDGRFGIVGEDGVHRALPPTLIDGCGKATDDEAAVAGARVLDSKDYDDVRTVVYGVGGPELRGATVDVRGKRRALGVQDGAFITAVRGYPEDNALTVRLSFAGGRTTTHALGVGPMTVLDPSGPAWRLESGIGFVPGAKGTPLCVTMGAVRASSTTPRTPPVCGATKGARTSELRDRWFFDVRTFEPGDAGTYGKDHFTWAWHRAPARTIVYGSVRSGSVARIAVEGPHGLRLEQKASLNGSFGFALDGAIAPSEITTIFTTKDGQEHRFARPQLPNGRSDS